MRVPDEIAVEPSYRSTRLGVHHVAISSLALGAAPEESYGNNEASRFVETLAPRSTPAVIPVGPPGPTPFLGVELASREVPTPTRNGSTIEFQLPSRVQNAVLTVYDPAGRLVERRDLRALEAGTQRVVWIAPTNATGIFFYRLSAGPHRARGRLVVIR